MTKEDILARVEAGNPVVILEARNTSSEGINYTDKKTGRESVFYKHIIGTENAAGKQIELDVRCDKPQLPPDIVPKKGQRILVSLTSAKSDRGRTFYGCEADGITLLK